MTHQEPRAAPSPQFTSVGDLIHQLVLVPGASPRPPGEPFAEMLDRTADVSQPHEVDEETYWYFLEVLPPRWMGRGAFAFAEGAEPLRIYVHHAGRYLCRWLTWDQTRVFCRLARIPLPH